MSIETMSTKQLQYADYRYEHCDGKCKTCPCRSEEGYYCYEVYAKIRKELNKRGE